MSCSHDAFRLLTGGRSVALLEIGICHDITPTGGHRHRSRHECPAS